jgi:membrane-bound lytic murein transglycosylase B
MAASNPKHTKSKPARNAVKPALPEGTAYGDRADVMRLADDIAQRRNLDAEWVRSTLSKARMLPSVVRAITPPALGTPKNWALYRSRFVEPIRIRAGVKLWPAAGQLPGDRCTDHPGLGLSRRTPPQNRPASVFFE